MLKENNIIILEIVLSYQISPTTDVTEVRILLEVSQPCLEAKEI
jgi:hypothetical protein